jgi:hypothetical protein
VRGGAGERLRYLISARFFDGWKDRPPPPRPGPDDPVAPAKTLLLERLWRRHGLIPTDHIPARGRR